jgi:hypothetical protein
MPRRVGPGQRPRARWHSTPSPRTYDASGFRSRDRAPRNIRLVHLGERAEPDTRSDISRKHMRTASYATLCSVSTRSRPPPRSRYSRILATLRRMPWVRVGQSVRGESGWWQQGVQRQRLLDSALHRHHLIEALTAWFHLPDAPEQVAEAQRTLGRSVWSAPAWRRAGRSFWMWSTTAASPTGLREKRQGRDPHRRQRRPRWRWATSRHGCCWCSRDWPGSSLLTCRTGRTPGEEHYRCVHRWVHARRANRAGGDRPRGGRCRRAIRCCFAR